MDPSTKWHLKNCRKIGWLLGGARAGLSPSCDARTNLWTPMTFVAIKSNQKFILFLWQISRTNGIFKTLQNVIISGSYIVQIRPTRILV